MKELIKTTRCDLTGDFTGIWVEIRTNPPMRVYEEFASGQIERVLDALATMTRASNLTGENDEAIDLRSVAGWREVSGDLISEVAQRIKAALEVPKANSNESPMPSPSTPEPSATTTT